MRPIIPIIHSELETALSPHLGKQDLAARQKHIAVMSEPFLSLVLEGKKTIESRFSLHNIAPYKKVGEGDVVFMKAGPIVGYFTVSWAKFYDLANYPIEEIKHLYEKGIGAPESFWTEKAQKRYVTLLGIKNVRQLSPITITKRDRRGWIVL